MYSPTLLDTAVFSGSFTIVFGLTVSLILSVSMFGFFRSVKRVKCCFSVFVLFAPRVLVLCFTALYTSTVVGHSGLSVFASPLAVQGKSYSLFDVLSLLVVGCLCYTSYHLGRKAEPTLTQDCTDDARWFIDKYRTIFHFQILVSAAFLTSVVLKIAL